MKKQKTIFMVLFALLFGLAVTMMLSVKVPVLGTTTVLAADEGGDDWDDWEDEGDEEDAFGNIMETTFATIDALTADAATGKVTAKITLQDEEEEATISSVKLSFSINDGDIQTVDMADNGDGSYSGTVAGAKSGDTVKYYVTVTDSNNNVTTGAIAGKTVAGVADMDNSQDIVGDDADLLNLSAGVDGDYLLVNFDVQGKINGGTIDPPYIQLYGVKITNPDTEQGEGLMVGKLWVYLPLATDKAVQEKFLPMLYEQGAEYVEQIGQDNIDRIKTTGMLVLDIQKLMGGNIMEGLLFAAKPEAKIDGGKFEGKILKSALGDNPSGYMRIITLTAANASLDSFMPIPLNCSNFLSIYTAENSYTAQ